MIFQWDEKKNIKNIAKHGISFEDARFAFADPLSITREDHFHDEERSQLIGQIGRTLLVVVIYTTRQPDGELIIRLISARPATSAERRAYENGTWVYRND